MILEAHADLTVRVSGNSQPRLRLDIAFAEVYVLLRARVYDLYVDALVVSWAYVRSDDDESAVMRGVPYAFIRGETVGRERKLDGAYWGQEEGEKKECSQWPSERRGGGGHVDVCWVFGLVVITSNLLRTQCADGPKLLP